MTARMGIKSRQIPIKSILIYTSITNKTDLYQIISENAPDAVKTGEIKNQFGRKVAIVSLPYFTCTGLS